MGAVVGGCLGRCVSGRRMSRVRGVVHVVVCTYPLSFSPLDSK